MVHERKCDCGTCRICTHRENQRRYAATAKGRRAKLKYAAEHPEMRNGPRAAWIARNPEKRAAQRAVRYAIRMGTLVRGECARLGVDCSGKIEAHHADYAKPLDVIWACVHHHDQLDEERREVEAHVSA